MIKTNEKAPVPRGVGPSKVEKYGWIVSDEPGVLIDLPKNDLHVDHEYQRHAVSKDRVLAISRNWSWIACGCITVAEREHTFFVIDGQHRVLAAKNRADIQTLPCLVFKSDGRVQEAQGFVRINMSRKAVSVLDQFRARVQALDPRAVELQEAFAAYGYEAGTRRKDGVVWCLAALDRELAANPTRFHKIWPLLAKLHAGAGIKERVVSGLFWLDRNAAESLVQPRWVVRLEEIGIDRMDKAAARATLVHDKGGAAVWGRAILAEINKGLRNRLALREVE